MPKKVTFTKADEENRLKLNKCKEDLKFFSWSLKKKLQTQVYWRNLLIKGDFAEVEIAQRMAEGPFKLKEQGKHNCKFVDNFEKELDQKKDSLITNFFTRSQN